MAMFRVPTCLNEQDWRLVVLAGCVCLLASVAAAFSLAPAPLAFVIGNAAMAILGVSLGGAFADRRLGEQNMRLDTAVNHMSQGPLMFNAEARLVLCNQRYLQIYGLSANIVRPGCTLRRLIDHRIETGSFSTSDPEQYIAKLRAAMATDRTVSKDVELTDGRTIAVSSRPMAGGGWVATHEDITEQKQEEKAVAAARAEAERAERELKQREASFRLLFEGNPIPMWVYDHASLRFIAVNDAAIEHYGYSRAQFLDMTLLDIRPAKDRDEVRRLAGTREGDYRSGRTWRHRKADGDEIDVAV